MNTADLARRMGVVANVLLMGSLFFVLIWWVIAGWMFAVGALLAGAAWLTDGAAASAAPSLFTAPE